MLYLVCVLIESLDPLQLWYINFSSFRYSTMLVFCKRALTYLYGILTSLPANSYAPLCLCSYTASIYSCRALSALFVFSRYAAMEHTHFPILNVTPCFLLIPHSCMQSSPFVCFTLFKYCDRAPWHKVVVHLLSSYYTNPEVRQVCFVG